MKRMIVFFMLIMPVTFASAKISENEMILREKLRLSAMVAKDQAVRWELMHYQKQAASTSREVPAFVTHHLLEVDDQNSHQLRQIICRWGWPDKKRFGEKYRQAMWLLMQHADQHPDLQQLGLKYLQQIAKTDINERKHFAYLWDRVQINQHKYQRFGTQGRCVAAHHWQPFPLEDISRVDVWRKSVGLAPLNSYKSFMCQFCY